MGDLSEIVLGLYGALPLPVEENPNRNLGRVHGTKTLVLADSPNKLTGLTTLKRAIELRDNLMGGWEKVIVLGWNFDSNIGHESSPKSNLPLTSKNIFRERRLAIGRLHPSGQVA